MGKNVTSILDFGSSMITLLVGAIVAIVGLILLLGIEGPKMLFFMFYNMFFDL